MDSSAIEGEAITLSWNNIELIISNMNQLITKICLLCTRRLLSVPSYPPNNNPLRWVEFHFLARELRLQRGLARGHTASRSLRQRSRSAFVLSPCSLSPSLVCFSLSEARRTKVYFMFNSCS